MMMSSLAAINCLADLRHIAESISLARRAARLRQVFRSYRQSFHVDSAIKRGRTDRRYTSFDQKRDVDRCHDADLSD